MRSLTLIILLFAWLLPAAPQTSQAAQRSPALEVQVLDRNTEQGIVGLAGGEEAGIRLGDLFWLLGETGVIAGGEIFMITPDKSAGRITSESQPTASATSAVVLSRPALPALRERMPPGSTIRGKVLRLPPGRHTAWIDITATSGLREGDQILVSRRGMPISRGRIRLLDDRLALTTLEPLVSNALPEPGDRVELWPAPSDSRWGRANTAVLNVITNPEGSLDRYAIILAGTTEDGIALERLADVYRGRQYIGTAQVVEPSNPNSIARMVDVATSTAPAEGDHVVVRAAPEAPPGPLTVPVFKVDVDYCLISAGEQDGVKEGETFLVRRQDAEDPMIWHEVAMLTVAHLQPVYSRATIKPLTSQVAGVQVWDLAERQLSGIEQWRAIGIVEQFDPVTRTAVGAVDPGSDIQSGSVVAWVPESHENTSAAIVLRRDSDHLLLCIPPGWGDMSRIARARIDAPR